MHCSKWKRLVTFVAVTSTAAFAGCGTVLLMPNALLTFLPTAQATSARVDLHDVSRMFAGVTRHNVTPLAVSGTYTGATLELGEAKLRNESGNAISAVILMWSIEAEGGESISVATTWDAYGYPANYKPASSEFRVRGPAMAVRSTKTIRSITAVPVWVEYAGKESVGVAPEKIAKSFHESRAQFVRAINAAVRAGAGKGHEATLDALLALRKETSEPDQRDWLSLIENVYKAEGAAGVQKLLTTSELMRP